jgi:hypothetical protein
MNWSLFMSVCYSWSLLIDQQAVTWLTTTIHWRTILLPMFMLSFIIVIVFEWKQIQVTACWSMSGDQLLIMLLQLKLNKILALSKAALVHLRISIFSNDGHLGWHLDLPVILLRSYYFTAHVYVVLHYCDSLWVETNMCWVFIVCVYLYCCWISNYQEEKGWEKLV